MALRQWMVTHEWMVKPTPQTEWIEGRGRLIWLAEVANSLGAGLYLVSLFYHNFWGMAAAWLIIVFLKMLPHLLYLGKPLRFWRMMPPFTRAWRTSWLARGFLFTTLFMGFVFIQLVLTRFVPAYAGTSWDITLQVLGGLTAFLTGIYSGFALSYCRSVPFWNSALLPQVFLLVGIADGFALIMASGLASGRVDASAETIARILLIANAIIIGVYLWQATYISKTARYSAMLLLKGRLAVPFWAGVIACGIVIPLSISLFTLASGTAPAPLLITAIAAHTVGAFAFKYVLLKAGIHSPLLPVTTSAYH